MQQWVAVLLGCLLASHAEKWPASIPRCYRYDPFLDQCLVGAVQIAIRQLAKGAPEFNSPPLDPWYLGDVDSEATDDDGMRLNLKKAVVRGLSDCHILNVKPDLENSRLDLHVLCPQIEFEGDYELSGDFMGRSLNANGHAKINSFDLEEVISLIGKTFLRSGRSYLNFKLIFPQFNSVSSVQFHLDGLDPDAKQNAALNAMFNENSLDLWQRTKSSWERAFSDHLRNLTRTIFDKVPINDIFLDDYLLYYYH